VKNGEQPMTMVQLKQRLALLEELALAKAYVADNPLVKASGALVKIRKVTGRLA
jgi:hypothetical protein